MGFQFVHLQNFSRKGDRRGRSTAFVLGEAMRRPDASGHILKPRPPVVVFGLEVEAVEALHDAAAAAAMTTPKGGKPRKIRSDQHTLCTVVMSHPYTMDQVRADPTKRQEAEAWERRNVAWLKRQFGNCLTSVVRHEDEAQYHLHAFVLPHGADMRASTLHPGQVAKAAVMSSGPLPGEDDKALNRRGDLAYRNAMREWQDRYFDVVGAVSGLSRLGPGRRRLSRAEWHAERIQADALRQSLESASRVRKQGQEYVSKVMEKVSSEKVKAATSIADARRKTDMAAKAVLEAARMHQEAKAALGAAEKVKGLGGLLRAFWDGVRFSKIRTAVVEEFSSRLDQAQKLLDQARHDLRSERDRRRDIEGKVTTYATALQDVAVERDQARSEVQRLRRGLGPTSTKTLGRGYRP